MKLSMILKVLTNRLSCMCLIYNFTKSILSGFFFSLGRVLMNKAINHLEVKKGGRICGLSGSPPVVSTYIKYGFINCVWDVIGYAGKPDASKVMSINPIEGVEVIRITKENIELLLTYDKTIQVTSKRRQLFEGYLVDDSNVICVAIKGQEGK